VTDSGNRPEGTVLACRRVYTGFRGNAGKCTDSGPFRLSTLAENAEKFNSEDARP
jgi:hypothetical protein